jgi:hypothetical protein
MKSIEEQQVDWDAISNVREFNLSLERHHYPVILKVSDARGCIVLHAEFKQPPILLKDSFKPGRYCCEVLKDGDLILSKTIHL